MRGAGWLGVPVDAIAEWSRAQQRVIDLVADLPPDRAAVTVPSVAAASGISGHGNLTQVVMAVSRAQLALQTTTAIRDRVVSAYQDIMKMSI